MRNDMLFHLRRVWMKESAIFSLCNMFAAVTRIECVDHSWSCLFFGFILRTSEAADRRSFATNLSVMNRLSPLVFLKTPIGSSCGTLSRVARWAMRTAANTGQNLGSSLSLAKGIFSPWSWFFWYLHRIRTNLIRSTSVLLLRSNIRSLTSRNSKSDPIVAKAGCSGQCVTRSKTVCLDWHHSLLQKTRVASQNKPVHHCGSIAVYCGCSCFPV